MGKKSAPKPPNPRDTSAAATGTNVATSVANAFMQNINEYTPDGNKTFDQSGSHKWEDPYTGKTYTIPTFSVTQTLSPQQQAIKDQQNRADMNLSKLGADQSARVGNLLRSNLNVSGLPKIGAVPKAGNINGKIASAGGLMRGVADAGNINRKIDSGGNIVRDIANSGKITNTIADAGKMTRSYNTDFSQDRQRVEEALMGRLNPQLSQDREALRTSLANQGLREGSEAFDRAMSRLDQQSTDARMQAILAGGQEQSRMVGLEANRAAFQNAAQQQAFSQNATRSGFANEAQNQLFGQNAARAGFTNAAQAQQFGQNAAQAEFGNQAQNQLFGQNAIQAGMWNDTQAQQFGQNQAQQQAQNAATQQNYQNSMTSWNSQQQARDRALQEAFALRNQPINEIAALMSGSQVTMPQFMTGAGVQGMQGTDNAALINNNYQQQLAAWQQSQAAKGSMLSGLGGLFGGIGAMKG